MSEIHSQGPIATIDLEQDANFSKVAGDINSQKMNRIHCTARKLQVLIFNIIQLY